jgi:hypothetical protein
MTDNSAEERRRPPDQSGLKERSNTAKGLEKPDRRQIRPPHQKRPPCRLAAFAYGPDDEGLAAAQAWDQTNSPTPTSSARAILRKVSRRDRLGCFRIRVITAGLTFNRAAKSRCVKPRCFINCRIRSRTLSCGEFPVNSNCSSIPAFSAASFSAIACASQACSNLSGMPTVLGGLARMIKIRKA